MTANVRSNEARLWNRTKYGEENKNIVRLRFRSSNLFVSYQHAGYRGDSNRDINLTGMITTGVRQTVLTDTRYAFCDLIQDGRIFI